MHQSNSFPYSLINGGDSGWSGGVGVGSVGGLEGGARAKELKKEVIFLDMLMTVEQIKK